MSYRNHVVDISTSLTPLRRIADAPVLLTSPLYFRFARFGVTGARIYTSKKFPCLVKTGDINNTPLPN